MTEKKLAKLYRMVMPNHLCPYGVKAKWLLRQQGYQVDDHHLTSREETDQFQAEHDVNTTPQMFINDERIGGYDDLRIYLNLDDPKKSTSYTPVIMIFSVCALVAIALTVFHFESLLQIRTLEWFAALSMTVLALQKLQDVESFSTMFLNYDLLARRWVRYGYIYPFAEAGAGVLMIAGGIFAKLGAPLALAIGTVGAISVFKAVYIDKREVKCACVGGNSNVPLGFVSLTENLVMIVMGIWMLVK